MSQSVAVASRSFSRHPILREELLKRYPDAKFNDEGKSLSDDELIRFLAGHEKAIIALEKIGDPILERLPGLKLISKYGVGLDNLDLCSLDRHGVLLGWQGGVNRRSVAELALCKMLVCLRNVLEGCLEIRGGVWRQNGGVQLSGKTVGIIGCGYVGQELISLLQPFGCRILAYDIRSRTDFYRKYSVEAVTLEKILTESDVVSLHVPLDDSTRLMLNRERLALMKRGAVLVNTARGGIVDEVALREMLQSRHLAAAAFDVFGAEPPTDQKLLGLPNFLSTPHIGGNAQEAILAMGRAAIEGLDAGRPALSYLSL